MKTCWRCRLSAAPRLNGVRLDHAHFWEQCQTHQSVLLRLQAMNNWRVADSRRRHQWAPDADAAVPICLFLVAVRPGLRWFVELFRAVPPVDRAAANSMPMRCLVATFLVGMPAASTFPEVQEEIGMPQHLGSKSRHYISDNVPACLHAPQRRQWPLGKSDTLLESS